jgi:MSHA biogenesis protein MshP
MRRLDLHRQRGASLITAIFLITVVAGLAALGVQIGTSQRQTTNFATLGDRAVAAAQSGIEWGAYQALTANTCTLPRLTATLNLAEDSLAGWRVQVVCTPVPQNDCPGPAYNVYDITSFAQWGVFGTPEYTSRRIDKRFTGPTC